MKRIAVVGIDGCGKSTVVGRFLELHPGSAAMTCPQYHRTPDAPLARLSERLDDLSRAADAERDFDLKATALFLQMTLYGTVEKFLIDTFRPPFLLSERHALVDSLAYGPFYVQTVKRNPDRAKFDAWPDVLRWQALRSETPAWELALHAREIFRRPFRETVEALGREYGTRLPDVLIFLDVDAKTAMERLAKRPEAELHETEAVLDQLRGCYLGVVERIRREYPEIRVEIVKSGIRIDGTLNEILERSGVAVGK